MTSQLSPTERSTIRRGSKRARTDRGELHATLDSGLVCHLAVVVDGAPRVLPTGYGRRGDTLYLHGSTGARSLRDAGEVCVSVTHVDGVVYSRSMMHHSINYRSAVIHGRIRHVEDPDERWEGLRVITEQLAPGSWDYARRPTKKELAATAVLALDLTEAAVKIRTGDPGDDAEDVEANEAWAGVLPLHRSWGAPVPSADLIAELPVPEHVLRRS
ncbi:pyridoxamine 5'-phosphate oxidase family protein [Saccharopolyspora endophytica]|uniref:Pyridoxamine 5'-phosphate oxidase family protein n=1 Tax=Saccharopolyspora endophytica TaxID=543886 RepID=A0ABS5DMM9_9PSEU|nr:pyridoxamine 5'-phosphate oxidase family protein [Saccharopolyspora endophytica]MBQ0927322.1 pyridoxamine 5'-phosphate oxidase family protein [Saccharopolyspora endophytica]